MSNTGVLVTGFGGPDSIDAVAPFMCNLMGREPSDELVDSVCRRYRAIGGSSPLPEIAGSIAVKLESALATAGKPMPVEVGMAYWHPFIEDALGRLKEMGCDRVIAVSLSAFESKVASDAYRDAMNDAAESLGGLEIVEAPVISELPEFAHFMAGGTATALMDIEPNEGAIVAFTAHSLPLSDLTDDDPYVKGLERVASQVAVELGLESGHHNAGENMFESFRAYGADVRPRAWYLVYQSKGQKPGDWLGPELDELIDVCVEAGVPALVVCPIGFVTDHMETLYDLDIVIADKVLRADMEFLRSPVPNDFDTIVDAIAQSVVALA